MTMPSEHYARLANDAYKDRREGVRAPNEDDDVRIDGVAYRVLEHVDHPRNGYQGTVYWRVDTDEIVIAHRGTEELWRDGVLADGAMVLGRANPQARDAIELTRRAMEYSQGLAQRTGMAPEVTVTGHSLGGTLAQISAHHFGLRGETFNAYGAASLGYRIPEGGSAMTHHVMATDVVSAASGHYGRVRVYARREEIAHLRAGGYSNSRLNALVPDQPLAVAAVAWGAHGMENFLAEDAAGRPRLSALADPHARQRAEHNRRMIEEYRSDVRELRMGITLISRDPAGLAKDLHDLIRGPLTAR